MEQSKQIQFITNDQLIKNYLTPSLAVYFYKKLPSETPVYINLKICELLKYLILAAHSKGQVPINGELDELWHLWILQTKQYMVLMKQLPGGKFIHHSSNDYVNENIADDDQDEINRMLSFLISYIHNFGDFTRETVGFWPMGIHLMGSCNFDVLGLNAFAILLTSETALRKSS